MTFISSIAVEVRRLKVKLYIVRNQSVMFINRAGNYIKNIGLYGKVGDPGIVLPCSNILVNIRNIKYIK